MVENVTERKIPELSSLANRIFIWTFGKLVGILKNRPGTMMHVKRLFVLSHKRIIHGYVTFSTAQIQLIDIKGVESDFALRKYQEKDPYCNVSF